MKRPSNEVVVNGLVLALAAAFALWLFFATEWVQVWRATPPRGQAARDEHHAIKQIVTRLGAKVSSPGNLDRLPPPGATLVLQSNEWDFLPGRNAQLRQWVEEQGGHLVLPSFYATGDDIPWVPVRERKRAQLQCPGEGNPSGKGFDGDHDDDRDDERKDERAGRSFEPPASAPQPRPRRRDEAADPRYVGPHRVPACTEFSEVAAAPSEAPLANREAPLAHSQAPSAPSDAPSTNNNAPRRLRLCNGDWSARLEAAGNVQPLWSLAGARGAHSVRVPLGNGRITAVSEYGLLHNDNVFRGDHAQAIVAALDLRPGDEVWFVIDEKRQALLLWLWHRAGPAIAIGLLALAFALWRGALRFGPLLPGTPPARRSVAEQIRGTAAFVLRGGGKPLLVATRRAFDDAARKRIAGYDRMTMGQRIDALHAPTGLSKDHLTRALDPTLPASRHLADKLALIEQARRRLAFNAAP